MLNRYQIHQKSQQLDTTFEDTFFLIDQAYDIYQFFKVLVLDVKKTTAFFLNFYVKLFFL